MLRIKHRELCSGLNVVELVQSSLEKFGWIDSKLARANGLGLRCQNKYLKMD